MSDKFKNLLSQGLITAAEYAMMSKSQDSIGALPGQMLSGMNEVTDMASPYTDFTPFAVTTGSGSTTTLGPQGLSMQMSPEQQQFNRMLQQQAMQKAQQAGSVTPQSLLAEMNALRQPEQQRAQLGLENRLAAQGRLGVQTNAYGGTPEQLAMQKAIQEQGAADSLAALTGARNLQQQDLGLAGNMLGLSYANENQAFGTLNPAIQAQQIGAGLNQTHANLIGQLGQQYLGELGSVARTQATLGQNQSNSLIQNLLGSGSGGSGTNALDSSLLGGGFNWLSELAGSTYGNLFGATASQFENYGKGNFGDAVVEGDYEDFLSRLDEGSGVNLPPTTTGGGGI